MDSLNSGPIADVLKRLHQEAEAADAPMMQRFERETNDPEQMITQMIDSETQDLGGSTTVSLAIS